MSASSINVTTDRTNYSYYSTDGKNVITATIAYTGSNVNDTFTVTLQRTTLASGAEQQSQFPGTITGPTVSQPIVLNTQTIHIVNGSPASPIVLTYDLRTLKDGDGYMLAHYSQIMNDYSVIVTNSPFSNPITVSAKFSVVVITPDEMKSRWFYGAPMIAYEQMVAAVQPQVITGILVTSVGFNTARGSYALLYNNSTHQITFGNGNPITISPSTTSMVLYDNSNNNITISVVYASLPSSVVSDSVFLDYKVYSDVDIIKQIIQATKEAERGMMTKIEPTHVVARNILQYNVGDPQHGNVLTDPNGTQGFIPASYDEIADGVSFYKQSNNQWINIELPYTNVLEVYQLMGFFNKGLSVILPQSWISYTVRPGMIQLVPTNYAILNWILSQAAFYFFFLASDYIPQFWAFDILCGLREGIPAELQEYISMYAAILILGQLGVARYPAGITGYSLSRDGVSESRTLIPGIYMTLLQNYMNAIGRTGNGPDGMLVRLRQTYNGLWMRSF